MTRKQSSNQNKWRIGILLFLLIVLGAFVWRQDRAEAPKSSHEVDNTITETQAPVVDMSEKSAATGPEIDVSPQPVQLPSSALVVVPFMSQAPFAEWDALHEDACEEASLIMVKHSSDGQQAISKDMAESEIQQMIQYEDNHGYGLSITLGELNAIARLYYGMESGRVEALTSIEDIKREVAAGRPVIIPAAGKLLPNPNFKNGGPNYHMLVVTGYDGSVIITNDPGTRLGHNFTYDENVLVRATHDWNSDDILRGEKKYLVFD